MNATKLTRYDITPELLAEWRKNPRLTKAADALHEMVQRHQDQDFNFAWDTQAVNDANVMLPKGYEIALPRLDGRA